MSEALFLTVTNAVATISINDAPYNRMSLEYIDALEKLLPQLAEDDGVRARKSDGAEALRVGLVMETVPLAELKPRAQGLGEELSRQPRLAVKRMLDTIVGFESKSLAEPLQDERAAVHLTRGTPDAAEGMRAFLEKRRPVFNQR